MVELLAPCSTSPVRQHDEELGVAGAAMVEQSLSGTEPGRLIAASKESSEKITSGAEEEEEEVCERERERGDASRMGVGEACSICVSRGGA
jgi:CRISPR/Cas system-associated protein Cas10 (large subunit of type III CRISPR-Cas system)